MAGGALCIALYQANWFEMSRVWNAPVLRENWAIPFFLIQLVPPLGPGLLPSLPNLLRPSSYPAGFQSPPVLQALLASLLARDKHEGGLFASPGAALAPIAATVAVLVNWCHQQCRAGRGA